MNNSKLNTLRFLLCLRESINLGIDVNSIISENDKHEIKDYIQNEATDYEILYYSISNSFPKQKHNAIIESELMEVVKYHLQEKYVELNDNIDCLNENILDSLIEGLKPLGNQLSSRGIVLEHLISTNILTKLINEEWQDVPKNKPSQTQSKPKNNPKENGWHDVPKDKPLQPENKHPESGSKALEILKNLGKGAALTVAVATILYGAYQTYKRYLSKSARACSGKSGAERDACVENYKQNAIKAQISDIKKAMDACRLNDKPQQCQNKLQAKINKLKTRLNS